jgi:Exonuclease
MSYFVCDVEADGQNPGDYSMIAIGAVKITPQLDQTFLKYIKPISEKWIPDALAVSGFTREETLNDPKFEEAMKVMLELEAWVKRVSVGQPIFVSDNNGFDAAYVNWYFHHFLGRNPFGWSSRRIGDIWCGMQKDAKASWKHLRKTKHTHNPLDDAMGNAEAMLGMKDHGLKIKFE